MPSGADTEQAFLAGIGVPLVIQFTTLIRTARTHDVTNQAFQRILQEFMTLLLRVPEEESDVTLSAVSEYFYLNGVRVRATSNYLTVYHALLSEFERRSIGGLKFVQGVTSAEFERFFQNRYGVPSPFPANRDVYPYAPVQMGFNGAFLYAKAVYSFGL